MGECIPVKELEFIVSEAERFRAKRANLAQTYKNVQAENTAQLDRLSKDHAERMSTITRKCDDTQKLIRDRAREDVKVYSGMYSSLDDFYHPVSKWCPKTSLLNYQPDPSRANEAELNQLISMVQEEGIMAWIKRTFHLNGYASRQDMARELCEKILDGKAYCEEHIEAIKMKSKHDVEAEATIKRRSLEAEEERYRQEREKRSALNEQRLREAEEKLVSFDNSAELCRMEQKLKELLEDGEKPYGLWGKYSPPEKMPERITACNIAVTLPDKNGIEKDYAVPYWINLFESNIIVITPDNAGAKAEQSESDELARRILSRLLKTVPPEWVDYTVFDPLRMGSSLDRLVDIINLGTTDVSFSLYTSDENTKKQVGCRERRNYLCNRPAEIIKSIAGHYKTLFEYNHDAGNNFEHPFSWIVEFNFAPDSSNKLIEQCSKMFINASAAGYSFLFVTDNSGANEICRIAQSYTQTPVLRIDCDRKTCTVNDNSYRLIDFGAPAKAQVGNFTSALKSFYENGKNIDNRIQQVMMKNGVAIRDASEGLKIPMALDSRGRIVDLELGGRDSAHGFISGGTGSGKSTLLHTIILSSCLHYTPEDLEIWLVDYKQTEFSIYMDRPAPHIKLIGVSKTEDFTFSLLDKIDEEGMRRSDLLSRFKVQNLAQYRKHAGEPGYEPLPRLFIIVDEFHEMSQFVAGNQTYKDKLENVLREYRAQGLTFLLADQTFSNGLGGLSVAAKNQIGMRIAMRNEVNIQEIKDTLSVDNALYSDSINKVISLMAQGDFLKKTNVRNAGGEIIDNRLEKYKAILSLSEDIVSIGKLTRKTYRGWPLRKKLVYVNTRDQVAWTDEQVNQIDEQERLKFGNIRFYLGSAATIRPCFNIDLGHKPDENLSIVGGTAGQRWELLVSILHSCLRNGYKTVVFMSEYSSLMCDYGDEIRATCDCVPGLELYEKTADWCDKLRDLEQCLSSNANEQDIVCIFIGLETEAERMQRIGNQSNKNGLFAAMGLQSSGPEEAQSEFDARDLIARLFSQGGMRGIRCVAEFSVYRNINHLIKIGDYCKHKIAFSMSADDCLMYLGSSSFQKSIGKFAVYSDGGRSVRKLLPYKI